MDENWQVLVVWERVWEQVLEVLALVLVQGWELLFFFKIRQRFSHKMGEDLSR